MEDNYELGFGQKIVYAGDKKVNFYKLDKSKPYLAECEARKTGYIACFSVGGAFALVAIVLFAVLHGVLSVKDGSLQALILLSLIALVFLAVAVFAKIFYDKKYLEVRDILIDCTLTDGVVTDYSVEKRRTGNDQYLYDIQLGYSFYDTDGNARSSVFRSTYSEDPLFYVGQNLMIAFNAKDSVIMKKFSLSEGAREFSLAEEERMTLDFGKLNSEPVEVDTSKPVKGAKYPAACMVAGAFFVGMWVVLFAFFAGFIIAGKLETVLISVPCVLTGFFLPAAAYLEFLGAKKYIAFKKIMKNPSFAQGEIFFPKTTYRGKSTEVFYRFIDSTGARHIEKLPFRDRRDVFKDGNPVVIAYNGELSEVLSRYTLK